MRKLYLIRGLPGSGREQWVARNITHPLIEDHFQSFLRRLADYNHTRPLVVTGEHVELHQLSPYIQMTNAYGIPACVVTCVVSPSTAHERTGRDIWELEEMAHTLQHAKLPEEWKVEEVIHYEEKEGWFRPVENDTSKGVTLLSKVRAELRRNQPSIARLRTAAGL